MRTMSRTDLQAAFVTALSPRPTLVSLRKPVSLVKRSRMTVTPVVSGDTVVGAFYAGMSHEEFMAGMGWGPAPCVDCGTACNGCLTGGTPAEPAELSW